MSTTLSASSPEKASKTKSYAEPRPKTKSRGTSSPAKPKTKRNQEQKSSALSNVLKQTRFSEDVISSSDDDLENQDGTTADDTLVPPGYTRLTEVVDVEEFDWDTLEGNDDLELVVLRVPNEIKPKHLTHLSLSFPPPSSRRLSQKVGQLTRKNTPYEVWSIPPLSSSNDSSNVNSNPFLNEIGSGSPVGGEELLSMNVLLPRKRKRGRLFVAPKPITQHLVLTAQPTLPTPPQTTESNTSHPAISADPNMSANSGSEIYQSPARYHHPKHLLKHRFSPTGSGLRDPQHSTSIPTIASSSSSLRDKDEAELGKDAEGNVKAGSTEKRKRFRRIGGVAGIDGSLSRKRKAYILGLGS